MRALIVDDDFYTRAMLHDMLREYAQCDVAVNGEEAVFAVSRAIKEKQPYDLVCLDLVMPEMDGQQALREIRAIEQEHDTHPSKEVKVIVITMLDDKKETHDAFFLGGATSYMVKPVEKEKLIAELKSLNLLEA